MPFSTPQENCFDRRNTHKSGDSYYSQIYRHIDYFLGRVLDHDHDALHTISEIRKKLDEKTGVLFHGATIKNYIRKYKEKYRESPLCQVGEDKWRLNHCYYTYAKIKPPKPRNYKIDI
jgi:RNase adaptor protein for sRNA GlmZ degradation